MKTQPILQTLVFSVALSIASRATSDVVTDWNSAALEAISDNSTSPAVASRALAILHASIYDAVNGMLDLTSRISSKRRDRYSLRRRQPPVPRHIKLLTTLFPDSSASLPLFFAEPRRHSSS